MHVVSDLFTIIRNGLRVGLKRVVIRHSNYKESIVKVLVEEGYIASYQVKEKDNNKKDLIIVLKYIDKKSVIEEIKVLSKPGYRHYINKENIPKVLNGFGVSILSTSRGVITGKQARKLNVGGELLGVIY